VGITPRVVRVQAHLGEHLRHDLGPFPAIADAMDLQALGDDFTDGHARIERRVGVLEHNLHVAPQGLELGPTLGKHILTVEIDRAASVGRQAQHGAADGRLAAARLTHQAERLPFAHREADAIDGLHPGRHPLEQAGAHREIFLQIFDDQQVLLRSIELAHATPACAPSSGAISVRISSPKKCQSARCTSPQRSFVSGNRM